MGLDMRATLPRALQSRRQLAVIGCLAVIVFILFNNGSGFGSKASLDPTTMVMCPGPRNNPYNIKPPPAPATFAAKDIWDNLKAIFDQAPTFPTKLEHPKHDDFPSPERLREVLPISESDRQATRHNHEKVVKALPAYPTNRFHGRGVVMLAGGKYSEFGATALGMLREVGSKLPVEVWMKDKSEDMPGWCAELEQEGMACRYLADYMDMRQLKHPYQWKIFTMLFSGFRDILFLDADNCPLANPDPIFETKIYKQKGAILWNDYWMNSNPPVLPYLTGISEVPSEHLWKKKSVESGQIFWNKEMHWKSLVLAVYYNYLGPDYWFSMLNSGWAGWGDKDTFPVALMSLGEPYYQIPHGIITVFATGTAHGIGMVQADPRNETGHTPLFLHSNIVKWSMRDLTCQGCQALWGDKSKQFKSHLEDEGSAVYQLLRDNKRLLHSDDLRDRNVDPEPLLWKVIEHNACRSVWGSKQTCDQAREYMSKTFGYTFQAKQLSRLTGYACLEFSV